MLAACCRTTCTACRARCRHGLTGMGHARAGLDDIQQGQLAARNPHASPAAQMLHLYIACRMVLLIQQHHCMITVILERHAARGDRPYHKQHPKSGHAH